MNNNTKTLARHYEQMLGLSHPWIVENVELNADKLRLIIRVGTPKGAKLPCPKCGKSCSKEDHREERTWRHLDTMQFETLVKSRIPRIKCPTHGVLSVSVPWASDYSRFTLLFEKFAIDVLKAARNITAAMKILKLSWDQIHEIQKKAVERGLKKRQDKEIKHVGIDEKSFLKGHSYVSLLTDLDEGCVLEVVPDRTEETTKNLLETLSDKQKKKVEAVAIDMWPAFMKATEDILPEADIVHDKYHVATYLGKAVDAVRKKENGMLAKSGDDSLKGTKYLWLTNPDNWSKKAKEEFHSLAVDELKVGRAWSIKETFRHFWSYKCFGVANRFFRDWYFWATHSKLKPIIKAAKTLKRHLKGILAYLKHHITNAVTEGLNSKIQSIKANARGFRNFEHYRIAIMFHCGKLELYP
jgi:transposase